MGQGPGDMTYNDFFVFHMAGFGVFVDEEGYDSHHYNGAGPLQETDS